jgi:hypothetical protein
MVVSSNGNVAFDTNTLFVDAVNNRVGVGTSSPLQPLDVVVGSNRIQFRDFFGLPSLYFDQSIDCLISADNGDLFVRAEGFNKSVSLVSRLKTRIYNHSYVELFSVSDTGQTQITINSSSAIGQIIQAAAGQTANLFEINSSSGSGGNLFRVANDGNVSVLSNIDCIGPTLYIDGLGSGGVRVSGSLGTSESLGAGLQGKVTDTWLNIAPSTTTRSAIQINAGVDPTTPNAGDMWFDGTNLKFYDGTTTHNLF